MLPKIQYKSRKKLALNDQQSAIPSEEANVQDAVEDDQNIPDIKEDLSRDVNEHNEEPREDEANVDDSEKRPDLKPVEETGVQSTSSAPEEEAQTAEDAEAPEVEHIEEETQSPEGKQIEEETLSPEVHSAEEQDPVREVHDVEEVSQPIEEPSSPISVEKHIELEEPQHADQESQPGETADDHQDLLKEEIAPPSDSIPGETDGAADTSPVDTLAICQDTPNDQDLKDQSVEVPQEDVTADEKQDNPPEDQTEQNLPIEALADGIKDESTQDNIPVEVAKAAEVFPNESPEDRAAREEIAKLNEEIRRAMEEEAAGEMIPHEKSKGLDADEPIEESITPEGPQAPETTTSKELANEVSSEKGDIVEEHNAPESEDPQPAENSIGSVDSEPKTTPEITEGESVPQSEVISKSNGAEDKEIPGLEEQVEAMELESPEITTGEPLPIEGTLQAGETSPIKAVDESEIPESLQDGALVGTESSDPIESETISEVPMDVITETIVLPEPVVESSDNVDNEQVDIEDESLPSVSSVLDSQADQVHISEEPELVQAQPGSALLNELMSLEESREEAIETPLPEQSYKEEVVLDEEPALEPEVDAIEPPLPEQVEKDAVASDDEPVVELEIEAIETPLPDQSETEAALFDEEPIMESEYSSNDQSKVDESQYFNADPARAEDVNAELFPATTEYIKPVSENTRTSTKENSTGQEPPYPSLSGDEGEAKTKEVVPNQDTIEQIEESEKDGGDIASGGGEAEAYEVVNEEHVGGSLEAPPDILPEASEMKSSLYETFPHSEPASKVVQPDAESHEDLEDNVLATDSQPAAEDDNIIHENTATTKEESDVKDADIDPTANATANPGSSNELELPETHNIAPDETSGKVGVIAAPDISTTERVQGARDVLKMISDGSDVETREPNDDVVQDGKYKEEGSLDGLLEPSSSQTIDEPFQLPGHIKHQIDPLSGVLQRENGELPIDEATSVEQGTAAKISISDSVAEEPSFDSNAEEHFLSLEEANTPGPEEFEGIGGAMLTLDVGSPLPSPTHRQTAGGDDGIREPDVVESHIDPKEMDREEHPEAHDSVPSQEVDAIMAATSTEIPSENNAPIEVAETKQLAPEKGQQEIEDTSRQTDEEVLPGDKDAQESKDFSTVVGKIVSDSDNLGEEHREDNFISPEIQNSHGLRDTNPTETCETPEVDVPAVEALDSSSHVEKAHPEADNESRPVKEDPEDATDASLQNTPHDGNKVDDKQDTLLEEPNESTHVKDSEKADISSSPSVSAIPVPIHMEDSTQEKKQPAANEEEHAEIPPEATKTTQDATPQLAQMKHEDPEDVRAREEVARLNAEFMKAIEEEQAAEKDEKVEESANQSTEKDNSDVINNTPAIKEQQNPNSSESAEDIAAREEIAMLNDQMRSSSQQQENGNEFAKVKDEKKDYHEETRDVGESEKPEPENSAIDLEHPKIELHQEEHLAEEQESNKIPPSPLQHDTNLDTSDSFEQPVSNKRGVEATRTELSEDIEPLMHDHEIHDIQDSDIKGVETEEGEETEALSESENEWDESVDGGEEQLAYLETIHEESHDESVSRNGEAHEDEDEDGEEEEMPKSRLFHPHWKHEDMSEDKLKEQSASGSIRSQDDNLHDLPIEDTSMAGSAHNSQDDDHHLEPSNLPAIDQVESDHAEYLALASDNQEHEPTITETAHVAGEDLPLEAHQDELEHSNKMDLEASKPVNIAGESLDKDLKSTMKGSSKSNDMDLPRVLEPSPIIDEMKPTSENFEAVEQTSQSQSSGLTPGARPRRPASMYHRNSDLSPEHEAVFSRVSQIRNSLTLSPEPHQLPIGALSPRSRSERFPPDEHRNYLDASINNAYNGWTHPAISGDEEAHIDYRTQLNNDNGRNRSHTVDTVPSFEHYPSEDGDSGPPTPKQQSQYSDPVSQPPHIGHMLSQEFQSSEEWSHQNAEVERSSASQEQNNNEAIKSPHPQETAEFDPFNPQEYKSPISSPANSSFNVKNVHIDQEYPPAVSHPPSLLPPEKILGSNASASHSIFTAQADEKSTSQLPANVHSVPWTQSEDVQKAATQGKETASPQRAPRPVSSIFARTRSLFESAGTADANSPPKQRPVSGMSIFNVATPSRSASPTPSQTRSHSISVSSLRSASVSLSKRSSLHQIGTANTNADYDPNTDADFLPKSLDGDGRLPSPAFGLPGHRNSGSFDKGRALHGDEDDPYYTQKGKANGGWMGGLAGLTSRGAASEGESLLGDGK